MYCSKCGASVAPDAAFCGSCGTPVGGPAAVVASGLAHPAYPAGYTPAVYPGPASLPANRAFNFAGFWLRVVAYLIDSFILSFALIAILIPLAFLTGAAGHFEELSRTHGQPDPAVVGGFIVLIFVFAILAVVMQWLYHAYLESGDKQATWGKQALGLYVTDLQGNRITFGRASGRFFAKIVTGLIPLGIGYIMAGFTERKQALHDMIASCLVLRR